MDDITTKNHHGKIATATYVSIHNYLDQYQLSKHSVTLYADGEKATL
jgi:hypothetical protein